MVNKFAWDAKLDYEKTYKQLVKYIKQKREENTQLGIRQLAYAIILLTQLRNGSRIGETIDAIYLMCKNKTREAYVDVEKRHEHKETRLVVLPEEVTKSDILKIGGFIISEYESTPKKKLVTRLSNFARRQFGFNTHALRYARITYLARKGVAPQLIAKQTGHARMDYILYYTQRNKAEDLLRQIK